MSHRDELLPREISKSHGSLLPALLLVIWEGFKQKAGSEFDLGRREGVQHGELAGKGPSKPLG